MNNQSNKTLSKKQLISALPFIIGMIISNYYSNKAILMTYFCIYYLGLVIFWGREIISKCKHTVSLIREIRQRRYFYVTDTDYESDVVKRREVGTSIIIFAYGFFFAVLSLIYIFFQVGIASNLRYYLGVIAACLVLIAIFFRMRYYLTSCYYYLLPIIILSVNESLFSWEKIGSTNSIFVYFIICGISYLVFSLILPVPYLRKVSNTTLIVGAMVSIVVPTLMEYIITNHLIEQIYTDNKALQVLLTDLPEQLDKFTNSDNSIKELLNNLSILIIKDQMKVFSTVNFLWLSGYVIGSFIINIKLKIGTMKANMLYDRRFDADIRYETLRDIVYFGGDSFKNRIVDNSEYRRIIYEREEKEQFIPIEHNWLTTYLISKWNDIVTRLQTFIQ